MMRQSLSSNRKDSAVGTPSKRPVSKVLAALKSSPTTPAKVRTKRESERQSMLSHSIMNAENITPQRLLRDGALITSPFGLKKPQYDSAKKSPLQAKDDLRPSPPRNNSSMAFEAEALMFMSPMSTASPLLPSRGLSNLLMPSPGEKANADLEQKLISLKVEEGALEALHDSFKSAVQVNAPASGISISDVEKVEREGMKERFDNLESSHAKLSSQVEHLTFELIESNASKDMTEQQLADAKTQLEMRQKELDAASATEEGLRSSLDESVSQIAALRLSIEHLTEDSNGTALMQEGFKTQIASLNVSLERAKASVKELESKNEELESSLEGRQKELKKQLEDNKALEASTKELSILVDGLRKELEHKSNQTESEKDESEELSRMLHKSLSQALELSEELRKELNDANGIIVELEKSVQERDQEVGRKNLEIVQLLDEVRKLKGMGNEFISNILEAQAAADLKVQEIERLKRDFIAVTEDLGKTQGMLKDSRLVLQETRAKLEDTASERNMWRNQMAAADHKLTECVARLEMELTHSLARLAEAQKLQEEAEEGRARQVAEMKEMLEREQKSSYQAKEQYESDLLALSERLTTSCDKIKGLEKDILDKDEQIRTLLDSAEKLEKLQEEFHRTAEGIKNDLAVADAAVAVHMREIKGLKQLVESKDSHIEKLRCEVADVHRGKNTELDSLRSKFDAAEAMATAREAERSSQLVSAQVEARDAKDMLLERDRELTRARGDVVKAKQAVDDMDAKNQKLLQHVAGLMAEVQEKEDKISEMALKIDLARVEAEKARADMQLLASKWELATRAAQKASEEKDEAESRSREEMHSLRQQGYGQQRQVLELLDSLDKSKKAADAAVRGLQEELRVALEGLETAHKDVEHLQSISKELHSTETVLQAMQEQLDRHQMALASNKVAKQDLEARIAELVVSLTENKSAHEARELRMIEEIKELQKGHDGMLLEREDLISTCAQLKDLLDAEKESSEALWREIQAREGAWREAFEEIKGWSKRRVEELCTSADTWRSCMEDIKTESELHLAKVAQMDEGLQSAERKAEAAREQARMTREGFEQSSRELQESSEGLRVEVAKQAAQIAGLHANIAELKAHDAASYERIGALEAEVAAGEKQCEHLAEERAALMARVEQVNAMAEAQANEVKGLAGSLQEAQALERRFKAMSVKNAALEKEKEASIKELGHLEEQMSRTLDSMQALINSKDREVIELREELESASGSLQAKIGELEESSCELNGRLEAAEGSRPALETRVAQEEQRASDLADKCSRLERLLEAAAESVCAEHLNCAALESKLEDIREGLRSAQVAEDAVLEELTKAPTALCNTLQQVCNQMVRARVVDDERRVKERSMFYEELNIAHAMLAETEASLQREREVVWELSEKVREAFEGKKNVEGELGVLLAAKERDMGQQYALYQKSELLQMTLDKYSVLMATLEVSPSATPSKGVARVHDMKEELERRGETIELLKGDLEAELQEKEEMMAELAKDFMRLKQQVGERQGLLDDEMNANRQLSHQKGVLEQQLAAMQERIRLLEVSIEQQRVQGDDALVSKMRLLDERTRALHECEAHMALLAAQLREVNKACEEKEAERLRMQRLLTRLEETCKEHEVNVCEQQLNVERIQEERMALERQRDELQMHYSSACKELLGDSTGPGRGPRPSMATSSAEKSEQETLLSSMIDYLGSSTPQDVHLVTDAPQRKEATKRRMMAASPEVRSILFDSQRKLAEVVREKAELEAQVSALQASLQLEAERRSSVETQLHEMSEIMDEERQLVLEERERMITEMTVEKHKLMMAFSDMLNSQGWPEVAQGPSITAGHVKTGQASTAPLEPPSSAAASPLQPLAEDAEEVLEWSVQSEAQTDEQRGQRGQTAAKDAKVKAVMIRLGAKCDEAAACRFLDRANWDTSAAVRLARSADDSGANKGGGGGGTSFPGTLDLSDIPHGRRSASVESIESMSVSVLKASPASKTPDFSFPSGYAAICHNGSKSPVVSDLDVSNMYAEAALQVSKESPIVSASASRRLSGISFGSAHGRLSLSLSPESMVRKSLNGPRFLF